MNPTHEHNRRAWDARVRREDWYIDTATEKDFQNPLQTIDPCGWLGGAVAGKRLLCLAAGGGRHSVLFAAAGAQVTVVDLSAEMLALDHRAAAARNLSIRIVQASMDDLSGLAEASFEIVVQPVSTCYVPDIAAVYRAVARVTASEGIYVSQHKQPVNLQAEAAATAQGCGLTEPYYRVGPLPAAAAGGWHREYGTLEFLHRWDQLLGGLCRSGFVIEDVAEPRHADPQAPPGSFPHRCHYVPPYIKIKARRLNTAPNAGSPPRIWMPDQAPRSSDPPKRGG